MNKLKDFIKSSNIDVTKIYLDFTRLSIMYNVCNRIVKNQRKITTQRWQAVTSGKASKTEDQLIKSNVPACLGGWLAVSHEWRNLGGHCGSSFGCPMINGFSGLEAIISFLNGRKADIELKFLLCSLLGLNKQGCEDLYKKKQEEISSSDILSVLDEMIIMFTPKSSGPQVA